MQSSSIQETDRIRELEDETSDSTLLLDNHRSRSSGEDCFENENVLQTDDVLSMNDEYQSRVQVEIGSTRCGKSKEKNPSLSENCENDSQNAVESRTIDVRTKPKILHQPLFLESSRSQSSSREKLGANSTWSVQYIKPARQHLSSTVECGREELGADTPSGVRIIKPTGTRHHPSSTIEYSSKKLGVNLPPTGTGEHSSPTAAHGREELAADTPWSVRFIKPTVSRKHTSPTSECGRENRDIFETGGEQSRCVPTGMSCTGGEEIEHLPGESPEPHIVISPSVSDEPRVDLCNLARSCYRRWHRFLVERDFRHFAKAPIFYVISTSTILLGINAWDRAWLDRDIAAAIVFSLCAFIWITLSLDRGQFSHVIGGRDPFIVECRRGCENTDTCIPWCCCSRIGPRMDRHSQYRHLEEDGAFEHEIADVSCLDPKDCPQMKMVEQIDCDHAESPDYPSKVSQVDVDVHVGKRNGEKLGAVRKHLGRAAVQTTKPHKPWSERYHTKKTFRADIHASDHVISDPPELSPIRETPLEDMTQYDWEQSANNVKTETGTTEAGAGSKNLEDASPDEDLDSNEHSKITSYPKFSGSVFKKFSDCSPTLSRFANSRQSATSADYFGDKGERSSSLDEDPFYMDVIEVSDADEFMCEHYGQSVACSCPTLLAQSEENIR